MSTVSSYLGRIERFVTLTGLIANGSKEKITTDTILITEGRPIDALYIVIDGRLKAYVAALGNKEIGMS